MQVMIDFMEAVLDMIPDFLWSEPIKYLWGLMLTGYVFKIILGLKHS